MMLHLLGQCSPLENMHFTNDLGFSPLDAVEKYSAEPVYLESNLKFLPTGNDDKQVPLALSS